MQTWEASLCKTCKIASTAVLHFSCFAWGYPTWHRCTLLAGVTDISANNRREFSSLCCQQWFINHYVCISISVLIWRSCSLGQRLLSNVLVWLLTSSLASCAEFLLKQKERDGGGISSLCSADWIFEDKEGVSVHTSSTYVSSKACRLMHAALYDV